jgi:tRNA threonylcarbamoyladenosine modification (KEOPS) complex Cgi121 subunit
MKGVFLNYYPFSFLCMKAYPFTENEIPEDAVLINPEKVKSMEELELAYLLAKKSFKNKRNIAKQFKYEFLLWLSGKTDIKSALEYFKTPKKQKLLVLFKGGMKLKQAKLEKTAEPLDLERISLSRIKN